MDWRFQVDSIDIAKNYLILAKQGMEYGGKVMLRLSALHIIYSIESVLRPFVLNEDVSEGCYDLYAKDKGIQGLVFKFNNKHSNILDSKVFREILESADMLNYWRTNCKSSIQISISKRDFINKYNIAVNLYNNIVSWFNSNEDMDGSMYLEFLSNLEYQEEVVNPLDKLKQLATGDIV